MKKKAKPVEVELMDDQTDLEILSEMMEDYDITPEDTVADFLEAIREADVDVDEEE
jgi:hypothetical protein